MQSAIHPVVKTRRTGLTKPDQLALTCGKCRTSVGLTVHHRCTMPRRVAGPGGSLDEILLAIQDAVNDAYVSR